MLLAYLLTYLLSWVLTAIHSYAEVITVSDTTDNTAVINNAQKVIVTMTVT